MYSVLNGDQIMTYVDCVWDSTFILSKRSITLPQDDIYLHTETLNDHNGIVMTNLLLINSNIISAETQCSSKRTPIHENPKLLQNLYKKYT